MDSDPRNSASEQTPHPPNSSSEPSPAPPSSQGEVKGRWTWPTRGGYRVRADRRCPVCGGDSNCQVAQEGAVMCSRPPAACKKKGTRHTGLNDRLYASGGVSTRASTSGHQMFLPVDENGKVITAPMLTPEQIAAAEADRERGQATLSALALETYGRGVAAHAMVRHYLAGRGIDEERLPGGVIPPAIRWVPDAPGFPAWRDGKLKVYGQRGAMCALVMRAGEGDDRKVRGLHMTYLVGTPPKVLKDERPRAWCGSCDGVARLGQRIDDVPGGVLLSGEGLETTLAGMAGTGFVGWAWLSADRLTTFELHAAVCRAGANGVPLVHTLVLMGDLDKILNRRGLRSKKGQTKTADAAAIARARYPWITVVERFPTPDVAGELVRAATDQDEHCVPGEPVPAAADRGVDWDDVIKLPGGPERVRRGLQEGIDLEANARHAAAWWAEHGAAWRDPGPPVPVDPAINDAADRPARGSRLSGAASAPTTSTAPSGTAPGGGVDASEGDGVPVELSDCKDVVQFENVPAIEQGLWCEVLDAHDEWRPAISTRGIDRAKLFLIRQCLSRGERRFGLVRWAGKWFRYTGGGYREYSPHLMFRWIAAWLEPWLTYKRTKDGVQLSRVNPTKNAVAEVMEQLASLTIVETEEMPCWLPDSLDDEGVPLWKSCEHEGHQVDDLAGDAREYISDRKGLIWLGQLPRLWKEARSSRGAISLPPIERLPHTPRLFLTATREFAIDLTCVDRAIIAGTWTRKAWAEAGGEWFPKWLDDAVSLDVGEERERRIRQLGQMFADMISPDRSWAEIIHLFPGPKRAGKGTLVNAIRASAGKKACWPGKLRNLQNDMGITAFIGRTVVPFEDLHVGAFADAPEIVETLKSTSGSDNVQYRGLYQDFGETTPTWRYAIFLNELPTKLKDESGALASRFCVWPLRASFFGKTDARVKQGVKREGPAICAWALFHYAQLFAMERPAIEVSQAGREMQRMVEDATAHLPGFLRAVCELTLDDESGEKLLISDDDRSVFYHELREAYLLWCELEGQTPLHPQRLRVPILPLVPGTRWVENLVDDQDPDKAEHRGFVGIALRHDALSDLRRGVEQHRRSLAGQARGRRGGFSESGAQGAVYGPDPNATSAIDSIFPAGR